MHPSHVDLVTVPSRSYACERLRGPGLPASFYSLHWQCYQFGSMLFCRLVLLGTHPCLLVAATLPLLGCLYVTLVSIRCPVASGMTLPVADNLPCVVSLRLSGRGWLAHCRWSSRALQRAANSLVLVVHVRGLRQQGAYWGAPHCPVSAQATTVASAISSCHRVAGYGALLPRWLQHLAPLSSCCCDTLVSNPSCPWCQVLLRRRTSCHTLLSHHPAPHL